MKISIITICFNNERDIRATIESVVNQTYPDIEYIIKDGGSKDNTVAIANEYKERFESFPGHSYRVISCSDKGIYDALNQGIEAATGDVVGFIHSGDRLYESTTLEKIAKFHKENDVDISFGNSKSVTSDGSVKMINYACNATKFNLRMGWTPSHMTVYTKRSLFKQFGVYLTDFGWAADNEWMVRYLYKYHDQIKSKRMDEFIIWFDLGGVSSNYASKAKGNYKSMIKNSWYLNQLKPIPGLVYIRAFWVLRNIFFAKINSIIGHLKK